ncbi:MAG: hypothetical protein IT372_37940 [Polyangiaceae bacterium]|nr:hypothetical protein [Polyangiaceae bacterium]
MPDPSPSPASAQSGPLPMRGGIVSLLASAFRLGDRLRNQADGMSTATAKRVLQDDPRASPAKRAALVRALVDGLFSPDYLAARGLLVNEIEVHNTLVTAALEDMLDRWDALVQQFYLVDPPPDPLVVERGLVVSGLVEDLLVRCAAYLVGHGRWHPVIEAIPAWIARPGLSGVYQDLARRTRDGAASLNRLQRDTRLDKQTLRALRDGTSDLPHGETLEQLAHAFARQGVVRLDGDPASVAEIEMDLRVGCAVARVRDWIAGNSGRAGKVQLHVELLRRLRSEMRRYTGEELAAILVQGTRSPHGPALGAVIRARIAEGVAEQLSTSAREAQHIQALIAAQPEEGRRRLAARMEIIAGRMRALAPARGGSKTTRTLVRMTEWLARAVSEEGGAAALEETAWIEEAVDEEEMDAEGAAMAAMSLAEPADPAQREAALREALARCPRATFVRWILALLLCLRGEAEEAASHLQVVVCEEPDHHEARMRLAMLLAEADPGAALAEIDEVHRRGHRSADTLCQRARCLLRLERPTEAEAALHEAIERSDRHVPALIALAECRRAAGDERRARELERRAAFYGRAVIGAPDAG